MKHIYHVVREYFRIGLLGEMEYRVNFFIQIFESLIVLTVSLGSLAIVFRHTETLGDWLPEQMIVLVGIYTLIGGLINFMISPSMERLMQDVRHGTLDFALTKPADAQLLVSVSRFEIWKLIDLFLGISIVLIGLVRLRSEVSLADTAVFLFALSCGAIIIYSFWMILATLSFWFIKVENMLTIFQSTYSAARWPITIYPFWLRFGLTFIIPIAFAVTVPVEGLIGRLDETLMLTMILLTVGLGVLSRWFWKYGLAHYSGASA
ncbi:MAG: ABC-2 family transporter protein [Chloroflexota bacterium]